MESELAVNMLHRVTVARSGSTRVERMAAAITHDFLVAASKEGYVETEKFRVAASILGTMLAGSSKSRP